MYAGVNQDYLLNNHHTTTPTTTTTQTTTPNKKKELTIIDEDNIIIIDNRSQYAILYFISHVIISFFAVYLSWKCNKEVNPIALFCALFCPYLYIIWALAMYGGCGVFESI